MSEVSRRLELANAILQLRALHQATLESKVEQLKQEFQRRLAAEGRALVGELTEKVKREKKYNDEKLRRAITALLEAEGDKLRIATDETRPRLQNSSFYRRDSLSSEASIDSVASDVSIGRTAPPPHRARQAAASAPSWIWGREDDWSESCAAATAPAHWRLRQCRGQDGTLDSSGLEEGSVSGDGTETVESVLRAGRRRFRDARLEARTVTKAKTQPTKPIRPRLQRRPLGSWSDVDSEDDEVFFPVETAPRPRTSETVTLVKAEDIARARPDLRRRHQQTHVDEYADPEELRARLRRISEALFSDTEDEEEANGRNKLTSGLSNAFKRKVFKVHGFRERS